MLSGSIADDPTSGLPSHEPSTSNRARSLAGGGVGGSLKRRLAKQTLASRRQLPSQALEPTTATAPELPMISSTARENSNGQTGPLLQPEARRLDVLGCQKLTCPPQPPRTGRWKLTSPGTAIELPPPGTVVGWPHLLADGKPIEAVMSELERK